MMGFCIYKFVIDMIYVKQSASKDFIYIKSVIATSFTKFAGNPKMSGFELMILDFDTFAKVRLEQFLNPLSQSEYRNHKVFFA